MRACGSDACCLRACVLLNGGNGCVREEEGHVTEYVRRYYCWRLALLRSSSFRWACVRILSAAAAWWQGMLLLVSYGIIDTLVVLLWPLVTVQQQQNTTV